MPVGVFHSLGGFHESDRDGALVLLTHLLDDIAAAIVVVGDAEAQTAHAFGTISAPLGQIFGLLSGLDHRRHDPHGAGVEDGRNKVICNSGNPHDRSDAGPAGEGHLHLQRIHTDAAVLHVENDEVGPGVSGDPAEPGREKLRRHETIGSPPAPQSLAEILVSHDVIPPAPTRRARRRRRKWRARWRRRWAARSPCDRGAPPPRSRPAATPCPREQSGATP